jgi:hypothetical protein
LTKRKAPGRLQEHDGVSGRSRQMSNSPTLLSLAGLQRRLNDLPLHQELAIAINDYRRLFGGDELGHGRLDNFALGHGCTADPRISSIVFRKVRTLA